MAGKESLRLHLRIWSRGDTDTVPWIPFISLSECAVVRVVVYSIVESGNITTIWLMDHGNCYRSVNERVRNDKPKNSD